MEYNWDKIKTNIYFIDGSLRDIYVNNITENDWEKWVNYVNKNYIINWNGKNKIDYKTIKNNWSNNIQSETANIFIEKIQINNHFFMEFENDIDPKEICGEYDHNNIINYMKNISKIMNKEIYLSVENYRKTYLIKIYNEEIVYNI
jgi:hypothetical protein